MINKDSIIEGLIIPVFKPFNWTSFDVVKKIRYDFKKAFEKCDVILTPTTPNVAFPIGEKQKDPIEMYLNDVLTNVNQRRNMIDLILKYYQIHIPGFKIPKSIGILNDLFS